MNFPNEIFVGERSFPVECEVINKRNSTVALKNNTVRIKLSRFASVGKQGEILEKFLKWAKKKLEKISWDFVLPVYEDGGRICTNNKIYELCIDIESRKNSTARLKDHVIEVKLPEGMAARLREPKVMKLVDDLIMKDQLPYLCEVLDDLNQLYFQEEIREIRFKKVKSRFGSCSRKRNINIAFSLLFTPREVFRYVCVHELSHLKEMNHGKKFWNWVELADPHYMESEKWLRNNGFLLG